MKRRSKNKPSVFVIGVTGSFGSGKSIVSRFLALRLGARLIDADKIAHQLTRPGQKAYSKIIAVFGSNFVKYDKALDRKKLARKVFSSKALTKKINRILHPLIIRAIKKELDLLEEGVAVIDAPLLFEVGLDRIANVVVVVDIRRSTQLRRLKNKLSLTRADILRRLKFQLPLAKKIARADFVIDNNGTLAQTKKQIGNICKSMRMPVAPSGKTR